MVILHDEIVLLRRSQYFFNCAIFKICILQVYDPRVFEAITKLANVVLVATVFIYFTVSPQVSANPSNQHIIILMIAFAPCCWSVNVFNPF